jgi:hypothetical protein
MIQGRYSACKKTGFVMAHAAPCESVAERMNCIILFREPGKPAEGLIADNYGMKGFRIDTKSCNWGPMRGFVCADPRLSKPKDATTSYRTKNAEWTEEAIAGHIKHEWFGHPTGEDVEGWRASYMPIVLSGKRITELQQTGAIAQVARDAGDGSFFGVSTQRFGDDTGTVTLPWRLVPARHATTHDDWWLHDSGNRPEPGRYYVLCVDKRTAYPFQQRYVTGVSAIPFAGYETVLGLCNPGTRQRGFKACVTADYDLFATWPSTKDQMGAQHNVVGQIAQLGARDGNIKPSDIRGARGITSGTGAPMPTGIVRMSNIDDRLKKSGHTENFRFGDISARVLTMKTLLNTAIQAAGGYRGGNAIHHNDEAGNFMLAKDNLSECLPLIGFTPNIGLTSQTVCIENLTDFKELVLTARASGYQVIAKESWLKSAGV